MANDSANPCGLQMRGRATEPRPATPMDLAPDEAIFVTKHAKAETTASWNAQAQAGWRSELRAAKSPSQPGQFAARDRLGKWGCPGSGRRANSEPALSRPSPATKFANRMRGRRRETMILVEAVSAPARRRPGCPSGDPSDPKTGCRRQWIASCGLRPSEERQRRCSQPSRGRPRGGHERRRSGNGRLDGGCWRRLCGRFWLVSMGCFSGLNCP